MKLFFTRKELHMRKKRLIAMVALIAVVIALYVILTWPKHVEPILPLVIVEPVGVEDVEIYGEYTGRVRAQQFVEVRARVEGFLESMEFEEGTYVNKNQVLFVIDQRQYRAKADKARAQLRKDSANVLKTRRDLERTLPLFEQNAASQVDKDNAIAAYEMAIASMGMSQADLDQAEQELGYTVVRSPLSGYISERYVDLGALVKSRQRNVVIGQKDSTRSWQPYVTITLADNSEYPYKGLVDFADPQVDPKTGTFAVRAEMPNPNRVLLPGQFTKVKALLDVRENATVVPQKALIIEKGGAYVFVMRKDSIAERRFIELGPEFGNNVVVERGIIPGEMIVTEGYHKLTPGIKMRPASTEKEKEEAAHAAGQKQPSTETKE